MKIEQFRFLFDEYYHPIKNFLYYKLGDIDLAEDAVQEVFLRAWAKRDTIVLETAKSYLYTIANNLAISHFTSAHKRFTFRLGNQDKTTSESPQYLMETEEFGQQIQDAIRNLSEGQRVVFLMNRMEELTYSEIAQRLGISVKAVEKRMHGALQDLREVIKVKF